MPESMYFSSTSGDFTTTFTVDMTSTAGTVIYVNGDDWYPNGYKWTMSHAESGKNMDGTELALGNNDHNLTFTFFDILDYNLNRATILITPVLEVLSGTVTTTIPELALDYNYVDTGYSGKCPVKVKYENGVSYNIEAKLYDRKGTLLKEFGKTAGSNGYDAVCADLIDAKMQLWSMSTSWTTTSEQIAVIDLNGLNGHDIEFTVTSTPQEIEILQ